jgi:DNA polymerase III subunit delta'
MAFVKETALDFLRRAHGQNRLAHAYLVSGPRGSGKRALAFDVARLVNGLGPEQDPAKLSEVSVIEPESKLRRIVIDQIRTLERVLQRRVAAGRRKVGLIFDADRLQPQAANAFLKTLEEPPAGSHLLLITAHPEMLLETILSRCIAVPLVCAGRQPLSDGQNRLLQSVQTFFRDHEPGLGPVFMLVRDLVELLQKAKTAIQDELEAALKRERAAYQQTTDAEDWLEAREVRYKALGESRYVQERFLLIDTLLQWWADVMRHQHGGAGLDLPELAADTAKLAVELPPNDVLRRVAALEALRENLNRNVHEALAIEVAFLNVFAPSEALR